MESKVLRLVAGVSVPVFVAGHLFHGRVETAVLNDHLPEVPYFYEHGGRPVITVTSTASMRINGHQVTYSPDLNAVVFHTIDMANKK